MIEQNESLSQHYTSLPVQHQYESMFRIDGVPILPPLMTMEKTLEMRELKAQAIKLENQLNEKRSKNSLETTAAEQLNIEKPTNLISHIAWKRSNETEFSPTQQKLSNETDPYIMLMNLLKEHEEESLDKGNHPMENTHSTETLTQPDSENIAKRMEKLQKSETIVYEYLIDEMVGPESTCITEYRSEGGLQMDALCNGNLQTTWPAGKTPYNSPCHSAHKIPSISVEPPTPVSPAKLRYHNFCDNENSISILNREDRSINSLDKDKCGSSVQEITFQLTSTQKLSDVLSKVTVDANEKVMIAPCDIKLPPRSATMGSLDVTISTQTESNLVRSNSFTVEYPSQVLIDHLREQRAKAKPPMKYPSFSFRATKDTVESKAKRITKLDQKLRTPSTRTQPRTDALSPYQNNFNCNNNNSGSRMNKMSIAKRSPYESKIMVRSKPMHPIRHISSNLIATNKTKSKSDAKNMTTQRQIECRTKELKLSEMEVEHKERLMNLIKQQQEEQKMLEKSYQSQKKMLIDQLMVNNNEVQSPQKGRLPISVKVYTDNGSPNSSPNTISAYSVSKRNNSPNNSLSSSMMSLMQSEANSPSGSNAQMSSLEGNIYPTVSSTTINLTHSSPRRRLFSDNSATSELTAIISGQSHRSYYR